MSCRFCGADFTLHERDLNTVCPKCFARVSDRAKFCHHCGTTLRPEHVAGDKTKLLCPACDSASRLRSRQVGAVPMMECGRCAGLWLGEATFHELTRTANDESATLDPFFSQSASSQDWSDRPPPGQWRYRKCPECGKLMVRRQYSRGSGVIIDACRDHGVWFDPDELPRILAWIRSGKHAQAVRQEEAEQRRAERYRKVLGPKPVAAPGGDFRMYGTPDSSVGGGLLGILAAAAFELFRPDC